MISALARSPWNGSTEVIAARLSLVTPPAGEPLTIAEAMSEVRLDSTAGEPVPSTAVTVALAGLGAGVCENGAHRVACSFVTALGETPPGPLSAPITVADKTVNGQLAVLGIPLGSPAVTTVKLWMPPVGTLTPLLYAGSVANGVTTATITLADASLGASAPSVNTAFNTSDFTRRIAAARSLCEADAAIDGGGTGRQLLPATYDLKLDGFPSGWNPLAGNANTSGYYRERSFLGSSGSRPIFIPKPPLQSVTSITYIDATTGALLTWDPTLYTVEAPTGDYADPGRIFPNFGQTYPIARAQPGAVMIRFVAGYSALIATLVQQQAAVPAALKEGMCKLIGLWWLNREAGQIIRGSADILPFGVRELWQPFMVL